MQRRDLHKILVSYRREDTGPTAGRLADRLKREFGDENVFTDEDEIPFGTDSRTHARKTIEMCDVVLVVIGPTWMNSTVERDRLHEAEDPIRMEIETAFQLKATVIPVLVDKSPLPTAKDLPAAIETLAFLNAAPLDSGRDFHVQAERIIEAIKKNGTPITARAQQVALGGLDLKVVGLGLAQTLAALAAGFCVALFIWRILGITGIYGIPSQYSVFGYYISCIFIDTTVAYAIRQTVNLRSQIIFVTPIYILTVVLFWSIVLELPISGWGMYYYTGLIGCKATTLLILFALSTRHRRRSFY